MAKPSASQIDLTGFGFETVADIGKGRFAVALLVREIDSQQLSVAKCVSLEKVDDEHEKKLANQEVDILQNISHPLIVAYRDSFLIEGFNGSSNLLIIVVEYCDGGDLRKMVRSRVESGEYFPEERILNWFVQVAVALHYIHFIQKVMHRDLKTSNIFLCNADSSLVKLGDFGISYILECTHDAAVTMVGTPYYMSPEVCRSQPYDNKSDIWALGCVLYELCMLKFAFESSSLHGLVYKIVSGHYEPIPSFYSKDVADILSRLLTKQAEARPSAIEILNADFVQPYLDQLAQLGIPVSDLGTGSGSVGSYRTNQAQPPQAAAAPQPKRGYSRSLTTRSLTLSLEPIPDVEVPEASLQDNRVLKLVLGTRVRRRLALQRLNWVSAFGTLDGAGDGMLTQEVMYSALVDFDLGLSRSEAATFADLLAGAATGNAVSLQAFEDTLAEGMQSPEVASLEGEVMRVVSRIHSSLRVSLTDRDLQRLGVLDSATFLALVQALLPAPLEPHESQTLLLLSDKDAAGNIDYLRFLEAFEPPAPPARGFDAAR